MKEYRPPSKDTLSERTKPELMRRNSFLEIYQMSTTTFYKEVKAGRLIIKKIGRCTYVTREHAEAWMKKLREDNLSRT